MIINTIPATDCTPQTIVIGRRGTYDTMQIAFDLSFLIKNYGSGTAVLAIKRSQDESAYPAVVTQEDNTLTWTVSETDTAYVGSGECQLMWYVDGGLAKTIIYPMVVMRDILQTAEEPPDGYENWIEHLTELGAETQQNAQNAAQSASDAEQSATDAGAAKDAANEAVLHYPKIENGYWYVWDVTAQAYQNTNIKAEGDDGYSPEVTITSIEGGHRVTITDKDHPQGQSFDVMDGQGGGGGTSDYTGLTNKPQINGHTLTGNQTAEQLDLATPSDIPTDAGDIGYDSTATYQNGTAGAALSELNRHLSDKQDAPSTAGTAGQVLGLDANLDPVWVDQTSGGVSSVNGKTGAVTLNASDVGAGTYSKPSGGIPATDLASTVQTSLGKADTALQTAPVSSVAGKTGAVTLGAGDIGYDGTETYQAGSIGAEVSQQKNAISQKEDALSIVQKTSSDVTITLEEDKFYIFPTMTELTVTCPLTGLYGFRFTSGTTPTVFLMSGITMPDNWNGTEASKTYDMTILNGLALVTSWSV